MKTLTIELAIIRDDLSVRITAPATFGTLVTDLDKLQGKVIRQFDHQLRQHSPDDDYALLTNKTKKGK